MKRRLFQLLDKIVIPLGEEAVELLRAQRTRLRPRDPVAEAAEAERRAAEAAKKAEFKETPSDRKSGPPLAQPETCPRCGGRIAYTHPAGGGHDPRGIWECVGFPDEDSVRTAMARILHGRPDHDFRDGELQEMLDRNPCGWTGKERDRGSLWG